MRIHLIAIGGAIMHNLAMELQDNGHHVSGSDDAINEPAFTRLKGKNLLPTTIGWSAKNINTEIDLIILGMHARSDNPELIKALQLGIKVMSFPEYMYEHAKNKIRAVISGSHGKTTTTSMLMHILKNAGINFDYLVGAQLTGYDNMVKLSNAPIAVYEGDEYTSSTLDLRPKFVHYKPHISIITGIAWDHINVFETHEKYIHQFDLLVKDTAERGTIIYFEGDGDLRKLVASYPENVLAYQSFPHKTSKGESFISFNTDLYRVPFFGEHNFQNLRAAYEAAKLLGVSDESFISALSTLPGPAKRLEIINKSPELIVYLDFAHAPSKVTATVAAVCKNHSDVQISGILELHTFSSINKKFIHHYKDSMNKLSQAAIYYDPNTALSKKMEILTPAEIKLAFNRTDLTIIQNPEDLENYIQRTCRGNKVLLLMSSGNFGGFDVRKINWSSRV